MSRKIIFGYAFIFLTFVILTLAVSNPALTSAPVGFTALFLPLLAVGLFLNWLARNRPRGARIGLALALAFVSFWIFTALAGTPGWGLFASLLMLAAHASVKAPAVSNGIYSDTPPQHFNCRCVLTEAHPIERGARGDVMQFE